MFTNIIIITWKYNAFSIFAHLISVYGICFTKLQEKAVTLWYERFF